MLCGLPHEMITPAPEWSDQIEAEEVAKRAAQNGGEGGPEAVSIVWTNRGDATDNFDTTFGTSDNAARAVVDAALDAWERVITSFNRADGTSTLQVTINIGGTGFGGAGAPDNTAPADGKPRTGGFTITAGNPAAFPDPNDSNGWYFDPTPTDHGEFNAGIVNAFAGDATAALGSDFFSIVVYEMTHVLGLITDKFNNGADWQGYRLESSGFATNTGVNDNAEGGGSFGDFWVFDGPTVDHLMTSYNSGDQTAASWGNVVHSAGVRPTALNFAGQNWQGSEDAGNASGGGDRVLPSWAMAHVLSDAYGYSIIDPEQFGTFYANLNTNSNVLTVRGGDSQTTGGVSNDIVHVSVEGSEIVVSVNVSNDVAGTRHLAGAGNLPAWTSRFLASEVGSIVIDTGAGDDDIFVLGVPSGKTVTVNPGNGNDFVQVGDGDIDDASTGVQGNVTVNGGAGTDSLSYYDFTDNVGDDTYTITSSTIVKTLSGITTYNGNDIESISVSGNGFNNTFDVNSAAALPNYTLNGFGGNDDFVFDVDFDTLIDGSFNCAGGNGTDTVRIDDSADTLDDEYQFSGNTFQKITLGDGTVTASSSTELFDITMNPANNSINIPQISPFLSVTVRGGDGNDDFTTGFNNLDVNIATSLRMEGGVGTDSVLIDDSSDTGDDTYTLTNTLLTKPGVDISYLTFESFQLDGNTGSNDFDVLSTISNCPYVINGFGGDDQLNVNDGSSFLFNFGSDITFNGGAGTLDTVSITDSGFAGVGTYTITNGHVVLPFNGADTFFNTTEQLTVTGSNGNNIINVDQTNIFTLVSGLDGNDNIFIGNGNFAANITADVLVAGGIGSNQAIINDVSNAGNNTWTITGAETTHNGATASVLTSFFGVTIDAIRIDAGVGNSTFNINGIGSATVQTDLAINAGNGADTFNLGNGALAANIHGNVTLDAQTGSVDAIVIDDSADTGVDSYNVSANTFTKSDWAFTLTTPSNYESYRLEASGANSIINMTSSWGGSSYRFNGNAGVDTFSIQGNNVAVALDGGAALDTFNVNTDGVGTAQARIVNNQDLANLNIGTGGSLSYDPGKLLLDTTNANIAGRMNINDGGYIERGPASEPTYRTLLTSGFAGGTWNGPAASIISSAAAGGASNDGVGYSTALQAGAATFFGAAVGASDMLIRYTFNGDNNLDGTVNITDFANLAANFNVANTNWSRGNYNYDLVTDISDFAQLAANFNQTVPADLPRAAVRGGVSVFNNSLIEERENLAADILV